MSISDFIKSRLKSLNMSQQQLADKLNITKQNLNNKLSRDNFSSQELYTICQILNIEWHMVSNDMTYTINY